jgi:hypothetical protein
VFREGVVSKDGSSHGVVGGVVIGSGCGCGGRGRCGGRSGSWCGCGGRGRVVGVIVGVIVGVVVGGIVIGVGVGVGVGIGIVISGRVRNNSFIHDSDVSHIGWGVTEGG